MNFISYYRVADLKSLVIDNIELYSFGMYIFRKSNKILLSSIRKKMNILFKKQCYGFYDDSVNINIDVEVWRNILLDVWSCFYKNLFLCTELYVCINQCIYKY